MKTNKVIVLDYDPVWVDHFQRIASEVQNVLGHLVLRVEHVGSTSVPGLAAKPIIDLDVVIRSYEDFPQVLEKLADIGYIHEGDLGIPGREAFRYENKPHLQKHHLYVCPEDSPELKRHVTFRDYLRSHSEAAQAYGRVKQDAAALYPNDIDGYIQHKMHIIEKLYVQCGLL